MKVSQMQMQMQRRKRAQQGKRNIKVEAVDATPAHLMIAFALPVIFLGLFHANDQLRSYLAAASVAAGVFIGVARTQGDTYRQLFSARSFNVSDKAYLRLLAPLARYLMYLFPVTMLALIYGRIALQLAAVPIGRGSLMDISLGAAFCIPWLAQCACYPLYREVSHRLFEDPNARIHHLIAQLGPSCLLVAAPLFLVMGGALYFLRDWDLAMLGVWATVVVLHVLFAQGMVGPALRREWDVWVLAWIVYAAALIAAPEAWFLAPGVAILFLLFMARLNLRQLPRPMFTRQIPRHAWLGLSMGALIWCDKFLFSLDPSVTLSDGMLFKALVPSVLIQNYFHVRIAPKVESSLEDTLLVANRGTVREFLDAQAACFETFRKSLVELTGFALIGSAAVSLLMRPWSMDGDPEWSIVFITSALLTVCMTLAHVLILIKAGRWIAWSGLLYPVACLIICVSSASLVDEAAWLLALTVIVTLLLTLVSLREWRTPIYREFMEAKNKLAGVSR